MNSASRYRIGQAYGDFGVSPSRLIEWEWVHTGRDFALAHPLARIQGGVLVTYLFKSLQAMGSFLYFVPFGATISIEASVSFGLLGILNILNIILLLRKHPAAWPFTWVSLTTSFPISLPLIVYWVDGVRPNLIYRHRFERLRPGDRSSV